MNSITITIPKQLAQRIIDEAKSYDNCDVSEVESCLIVEAIRALFPTDELDDEEPE